jgi:hypothetical protein
MPVMIIMTSVCSMIELNNLNLLLQLIDATNLNSAVLFTKELVITRRPYKIRDPETKGAHIT